MRCRPTAIKVKPRQMEFDYKPIVTHSDTVNFY